MGKISEQEKELIKEESRKFLKDFSRKLENLKQELSDSFESQSGRKEFEGWNPDKEFKRAILQNAPFVEKDLIIAERGGWK
jgi:hypothetical protein